MADSSVRERMYSRMRSLRLYNLEEGSLIRAELDSYLAAAPFVYGRLL